MPARRTERSKAATRERLLEAAATEFAAHGLDAANINEISLGAGLAKGTVYNYFPSKQALFLAVIEQGCALAAQAARAVAPDTPVRERLRAAIEGDLVWARAHEPFARVLLRELLSANPRLYPAVLQAAAPLVEAVIGMLADGQARGEIRADIPPDRLALAFLGLGDLALLQHWGTAGGWPSYEEIPDLVLRLFLEGAAEPAPAGGSRSGARRRPEPGSAR
ncbi:MAG TPA: TetR/AcrR family transcriptional regulator [Actinomycetes bacterium]|jgi:AcrR family transcriptional regulator|nr:TetR/AcrR family transcriptional regulator [Actinomycetes bacterium]